MKNRLFALALMLTAACNSIDRPAQRERPANNVVTVPPDNRVALRATLTSQRGKPDIYWSWLEKDTNMLVLEVNGETVNAHDINKIISKAKPSGAYDVTVLLRDGRKISSVAGYRHMGDEAKPFGPAWRACNRNGSCKDRYPLASNNIYNNLDGILSSIMERDLSSAQVYPNSPGDKLKNNLAGMLVKDPALNIASDSRAVLTANAFQEITVLIDNDYSEFEKRITALRTRWAAETPKRTKILADIEQERVDADISAQQAAIKAGRVNCVSTSYSCSGTYSDVTSLNCHTFNSAVWKMAKAGWQIESVTPQLIRGSLGEACDHYIYHFNFRR